MILKAIAITAALAFTAGTGSGYWAKSKLVNAAEKTRVEKALADFGIEAQNTVKKQDRDWRNLVDQVNSELAASVESRKSDSLAEARTAQTLKETSDAIRKISKTIPLVSDVGVCLLTDDFIRVWNDIQTASETGRTDAPDRPAARSVGQG